MKRYRRIAIFLLSVAGIAGLVRGYRMTQYPAGGAVIFPYSPDEIKDSVFSNYSILGWVVFSMIGIFSIITIVAILYKTRHYAYLVIAEGIVMLCFTLLHIIFTSFSCIHFFLIPFCIAVIILGILLTPKEF